MMDKIAKAYGYLWQRTDPNWVLLKGLTGGYCVYNKLGNILIIEDDEVNEIVCKRMLDAGCEILDTLSEMGSAEVTKIPSKRP